MVELAETLCCHLHVEHEEREQLGQARFDAQAISNHALVIPK